MTETARPTVTIKKYANRRLYNTATSSYVTLEDLSKMVKQGTEFNVYDAKSSEDITRSVLTQIIVEEEGKAGQNLLPIGFLRQLIGFYGDNMQWLVPKYLEHSMQSLSKNQEQIRGYFQSTFGHMFPFGSTLEEMGKQNMAMFERAMKLFAPGLGGKDGGKEGTGAGGVFGTMTPENFMAGMASMAKSAGFPSPFPAPSTTTAPASTDEKFKEEAVKPATKSTAAKIMPMTSVAGAGSTPAFTTASSSTTAPSGDDVQNKIAALQRQLADLAKAK